VFTIGEFKGNMVISLKQNESDRFGLTFGLTKAKLILDHIEDIRKFYEENKDKVKRRTEAQPE
jgi:phosphate starvation-inducible protein PhoH